MRRLQAYRWLLVAASICALIFVQSSFKTPSIGESNSLDEALHVTAHLLLYGGLAFSLSRHAGKTQPVTSAAIVLFATLYGVTDEIHQSFVPSRTGAPGDVLVDAIGACAGVALSAALGFGKPQAAVKERS